MPETNDTGEDRFDVVIVSFTPRDVAPEIGLTRVFGIDGAAAVKVVREVPVVVQRGVNRVRAEYFRKALDSIGAKIEVRAPDGKPVPAFGLAEAATLRPPAAPPTAAVPVVLAAAPAISAAIPAAAANAQLAVAAPANWGTLELPMGADSARFAASASANAHTVPQSSALGAPSATRTMLSSAAAAGHAAAPVFEVRAPAHPTLREGGAAAASPAVAPTPQPSAAAAPAPPALRRGFRFGDTAPPFMQSSLPPIAAAAAPQVAAAPTAHVAPAPVVRAAAAPVAPAAPAVIDSGYAGLTDSVIDRGRGGSFELASDAAQETDKPHLMLAALELQTLPNAAGAAAAPAHAAAKNPAHAAAFDISKSIPVTAPLEAPGRDALQAAIRKRAVLEASSNLGTADGANKALLDRWEPANAHGAKESRRPGEPGAAGPASRAPRSAATVDEPVAASRPHAQPQPRAHNAGAARPFVAAAAGVAAPRAPQPAMQQVDTRSFWETLPDAFAFPFLGHGLHWIGAITAWAVVVGVISGVMRGLPVIGPVASVAFNTSLLALAADFHRKCYWSIAAGETALESGPSSDPTLVMTQYVKSGANLSFFLGLSQLPLVMWLMHLWFAGEATLLGIVTSPISWLLAIGPGFYWPMALNTASLNSDFGAVWHVHVGLRAIMRAPIEYTCIVLLAAASFVLCYGLFMLIGFLAGLSPAFFACTVGAPLAITNGLLGALSGHLTRARPEVFE